jgi:hypothetical protein
MESKNRRSSYDEEVTAGSNSEDREEETMATAAGSGRNKRGQHRGGKVE